jgi:probable phosphomutase (TIGR03848 family)
VTTVLLVRHGLTRLTGPVLAGWLPGLHLDERGTNQAAQLAERLRPVPLTAVVTSPLERCLDTVVPILAGRTVDGAPQQATIDERLGEARYGDWTGQELKVLARDPLWKTVQSQPSAVTFPNGEALRDVQGRALDAVREWNARLGPGAVWLACSHADVIKSIVADALGLHLDQFQRIGVAPASLSAISYERNRTAVLRVNDTGGTVDDLLPPKRRRSARRN